MMRPESSKDMGEPLDITWSSGTIDLGVETGRKRAIQLFQNQV